MHQPAASPTTLTVRCLPVSLSFLTLSTTHASSPNPPTSGTQKIVQMRSPAHVALALGLAAAAAAPGCQAFFLGGRPAAPAPSRAQYYSAATATTTTSLSGSRRYLSSARSRAQPLCMSGDDEAETKSPSELMDDAAEADFVARASTPRTMGPAMGPAKQPEEDKRKQREKSFELKKPEENKWASGAFKRGVALQVWAVTGPNRKSCSCSGLNLV